MIDTKLSSGTSLKNYFEKISKIEREHRNINRRSGKKSLIVIAVRTTTIVHAPIIEEDMRLKVRAEEISSLKSAMT